jgi:DNA-binding GntR family transcriptional regulator
VPIYYLENFIRGDLARHLSKQELALRPLLKILKEKARITVGRGEMYIEAVPAEPDVAEVLHSQIFEPLILLTVFYWLKSGAPMEVVNCFMRPDFFKYRVDIDAEGFERI